MKLNHLVTLERGHLSWFWYPTHGIGTYLGRGVVPRTRGTHGTRGTRGTPVHEVGRGLNGVDLGWVGLSWLR